MMFNAEVRIFICVSCLSVLANGECGDCQLHDVDPCVHGPSASWDGWYVAPDCPDECEGEFSTYGCGCCGSDLHGDVHPAVALQYMRRYWLYGHARAINNAHCALELDDRAAFVEWMADAEFCRRMAAKVPSKQDYIREAQQWIGRAMGDRRYMDPPDGGRYQAQCLARAAELRRLAAAS